MLKQDYQIVKSRWIDLAVLAAGTLVLGRFFRVFLFRQELINIQTFMEARNMDVKFWKAFTAFTLVGLIGLKQMTNIYKQPFLADLAVEYSPNFADKKELTMK